VVNNEPSLSPMRAHPTAAMFVEPSDLTRIGKRRGGRTIATLEGRGESRREEREEREEGGEGERKERKEREKRKEKKEKEKREERE